MKLLATPTVRIVLYEGRGAAALSDSDRFDLLGNLLDGGLTVTCTGSGDEGSLNSPVSSVDESVLIVLGCFDDGRPPDIDHVRITSLPFRWREGSP